MKTVSTGLSLPTDLFIRIESERGDISRSRYLLRLLEKALEENQNKEEVEGDKPPNLRLRQEANNHTKETHQETPIKATSI